MADTANASQDSDPGPATRAECRAAYRQPIETSEGQALVTELLLVEDKGLPSRRHDGLPRVISRSDASPPVVADDNNRGIHHGVSDEAQLLQAWVLPYYQAADATT